MGWLSNIFKKKEVRSAGKFDASEVDLDGAVDALKDKLENKNTLLEDDLKKMHAMMMDASNKFSASLTNLKESPGPSKVDQRVMDVVVSYRVGFIKGFNDVFIEMSKNVPYTIVDFNDYFKRCSKSIVAAEENVSKFVNPLKQVFPGSMDRVFKSSKELSDVVYQIKADLEKKSADVGPVIKALDILGDLKDVGMELTDARSELEKKNKEMDEMKSKIESLKDEGDNLEHSMEWKELKEKADELKSANRKQDDIRSVVLQSIVPLDKAMKRLKKMVADGEESFQYSAMLDLYIEDPVSAFLKDAEQRAINEIIMKIKSLAESGKLEIDDKKGQKVLERVASMESGNILVGLRKDYQNLDDSKRRLDVEIKSSEVGKRKLDIDRGIKNTESRIDNSHEEISKAAELVAKIEEKKVEKLSELRSIEKEAFGETVRLKDI